MNIPGEDRDYPARTIRTVYLWTNGLIMVFDERGNQWGKFQGPMHDRKWEAIKHNTCGEEKYFIASGSGWSHEIGRQEFLAMCGDPGAYRE